MSLRRDRPRQRERKAWVSPPVWEALFRWSPLLSIMGAAAGGFLLIRLILVSSSSEYSFGPDILIAGAVLIVWGVGVWVFMSPPPSSLAQEAEGASMSGVIWPLGRRLRLWNVAAAPVFGLLLGMVSGPSLDLIADVVNGGQRVSATDSTALVLGGSVVLGVSFVARLPLWGAEVRSDYLTVRGALLTRRYRRSDIVSVHCYQVAGLADWLLGILFNSPTRVFYTLRIRLENGRTRTFYASHSSKYDIDRAARVVNAWITPRSAVAATAPSLA